jgi:hypothetical protein
MTDMSKIIITMVTDPSTPAIEITAARNVKSVTITG